MASTDSARNVSRQTIELVKFGQKLRGSFVPGFAYSQDHQPPPPTSQPQPMQPGQRKPGTPTRPEDDQRRTHRPGTPRQGEQQRPSPNRQVRPK